MKVKIGNIRGPQGPEGPEGPEGKQGPTGATGATGQVDESTPISFEENSSYVNIESGESIATISGKCKKILGGILTGAGSTLLGADLTAGRVLLSNSSGKITASNITDTELGYLDGLTGNVQTSLNSLTEKRAWQRIAHIEKATSGKVTVSAATLKTAKEYMIGWRLFPSHPWTYSVSFNVTSEIMSSMYFSDTYRASLGLTIAADGNITIDTEWTGGKHGTTVLTAASNLDLYVYMR